MQIKIDFDERTLKKWERLLAATKANIPKILAAAVNDTVKQTKTGISRMIRGKVNIKKQDIDRFILSTRAVPQLPFARVTLSKSKRLPLKYFKPRQTKKGVTYSIEKVGKRKTIAGGFISQTLHGHAFRRTGKFSIASKGTYKGQRREHITRLDAISPWGVFVKAGMRKPTVAKTREQLNNNFNRRVRLHLLRAQGAVATPI